MAAALETQKQSAQWRKQNGQFVPLPTTWLNQRRWEDGEPAVSQINPGDSRECLPPEPQYPTATPTDLPQWWNHSAMDVIRDKLAGYGGILDDAHVLIAKSSFMAGFLGGATRGAITSEALRLASGNGDCVIALAASDGQYPPEAGEIPWANEAER